MAMAPAGCEGHLDGRQVHTAAEFLLREQPPWSPVLFPCLQEESWPVGVQETGRGTCGVAHTQDTGTGRTSYS